MLIWGGAYASTQNNDDGARLDPTTGQWLFLPIVGSPFALRQMPAVWTGTVMLSWGGTQIADGNGTSQMVQFRP